MNIVYKFTSKVTNKFYIGSKSECIVDGNNIIDLNDMIIKSIKLVDKYKLKFDYKYISFDKTKFFDTYR